MPAHPPPVPPAQRNRKGAVAPQAMDAKPKSRNPDTTGRMKRKTARQGNIAQNTRNQGYQQDR